MLLMKTIFKSLFALLALVLITNVAKAQNTAGTPYAGSTHVYTVDVENTSNTLTWEICSGSSWNGGNVITDYALTNDISDSDNSKASITWGTGLAAGDYTIRFTEYDGSCYSYRTSTITIKTNAFDLIVSGQADNCADASVNGLATTQSNPGFTTRTFTVTNSDFTNVASWSYTLTVNVNTTPSGNEAAYTIAVDGTSKNSGDVIAATGETSTIIVTVDNDKVLLAEQVVGVSFVNQTAGFTESNTGNNSDVSSIYKLPNTGDITF